MMAADKLIEQAAAGCVVAPWTLRQPWQGFLWPFAVGLTFLAIPPLLFISLLFWVGNNYQPLGLADALNLAYRIGDRQLYSARGMEGHPGVPFYFLNWLALALTGFPAAREADGTAEEGDQRSIGSQGELKCKLFGGRFGRQLQP
jgi:hypothetical protein